MCDSGIRAFIHILHEFGENVMHIKTFLTSTSKNVILTLLENKTTILQNPANQRRRCT